jgi:hypothetical protein
LRLSSWSKAMVPILSASVVLISGMRSILRST